MLVDNASVPAGGPFIVLLPAGGPFSICRWSITLLQLLVGLSYKDLHNPPDYFGYYVK